ncbi:MAG: hypothetical protein ACTSRG_22870 [Candidatus Helarchaeota archaeon]
MKKKVLFLDSLAFNSNIQVGSHKYAQLFRKNKFDVFSLSHYINVYKFIRRNNKDKELIKNWIKGIQVSKEGIYYYTPFCLLPYFNFWILDDLKLAKSCLKYCYPKIKNILVRKRFINLDVLFINNINLISILNYVKSKVIVCRISDRIESFKNVTKTILSLQKEVLKISDIVFVTSKRMQSRIININENTYYLPNGVDEDFIMRKEKLYEIPNEFKSINNPIIIYIGSISDWFDFDLYEFGVKNLSKASFVIIGPVSGIKNLNKIKHLNKYYRNFYYLGPKSHSELKNYLAHANIGIIPFKVNSLTNEINPVKLFEYAAFGLPIISPPLCELKNYKDYIYFYENKTKYITIISSLLRNRKCDPNKLINFSLKNTWEKRFNFIRYTIENYQRK